jgi:hypothetical protein
MEVAMDESCGSRARPFWLGALRAAVATSILGFGASAVYAQPAPQPVLDEQAAPAEESPIQRADTPIVGTQSSPALVPEPPPPPAPPGGGGPGPALIPDGEAPPGPVAPAFPPVIPNIDFAGRLRLGLHTASSDATNPQKVDLSKMNDLAMEVNVDMYFSGQVTRIVKWQAGVTGSYSGFPGSAASTSTALTPPLGANAQILDVIARFEFLPEFNLYAGRMIVVADRFTPSGPWGMDEYFYPGIMVAGQAVPAALMKSGLTGRDVGVNAWGALLGGTVKYYLGAYEFSDPSLSPLFSGRLQLSLLTPEPGFYQRTTYYGYKDLIAIGIGGQFQKNGSAGSMANPMAGMGMPAAPTTLPVFDNYSYVTGDLVIDKKLGDAGTLSFVGSVAKFDGDYQPWKSHFQAGIGYLIPGVVGIGKLRPSIRYQGAKANGVDNLSSVIDAQIGYVIMPWFARVALGYRWSSTSYLAINKGATTKGNMIYLGITIADP